MVEQAFSFFITSVSFALIVFSIHTLSLRIKQQPCYQPLVLFFLALMVLISKPLTTSLAPFLTLPVFVLALPALLLIPPSLWCYVEGLTHTTKWQFTSRHLKHFALPLFGGFIAISTLLLPTEIVRQVLTDGGEALLTTLPPTLRYFIYSLLIATFVLVLVWILQSSFYVYAVFRRLTRYRAQLKQVFASTESKEFYWISWLFLAIGSTWLFLAIYLVIDNLIGSLSFAFEPFQVLLLGMIWSVSVWALRSKPGFEEVYLEPDMDTVFETYSPEQTKYQKSALTEAQAKNIAQSLESFMQEQQAFLDPDLSLQKLAKSVNTTANYLSQTLNEQLDMSFFDYVNGYRIEMAKTLLDQSKNKVLDIAMEVGFNSKSAFYSAFKKHTLTTPNEYRKQQGNTSS